MRQIEVKPEMELLLDNVSHTGSENTGRNLGDWKKDWKKPWVERADFDPWLHSVSHPPHSLAFAEVTGPLTKGSKTEQPTFHRDWTVKWSHNLKYPGSPVVRTPCFCCQEHGFIPDLRTKIPQAMQHTPYPKKKKNQHPKDTMYFHKWQWSPYH